MSDQNTDLNISIRDLPAVHAACIRCPAQVDQGQFSPAIRENFPKVQQWLKGLGQDPYTSLTVGVIYQAGGQLSHYDCCVQVPEGVLAGGDEYEIYFERTMEYCVPLMG